MNKNVLIIRFICWEKLAILKFWDNIHKQNLFKVSYILKEETAF
jgi:hypothetical protein